MYYFNQKIKSHDKAKKFIKRMVDDDLLFHFDDDPRDIITKYNEEYEQLFSENQCKHLDRRVNELFRYLGDPFEYVCELLEIY